MAAVLALLVTLEGWADDRGAGNREDVHVTVEQTEWGFDGKACAQTFVPLSVLLRNDSTAEFEGTLRLERLLRSETRIDAVIELPVYLGPVSSRWVQFCPFVAGDWELWQLSWKGGDGGPISVPTPTLGDRATVLLHDPELLPRPGGSLRRFSWDLFPSHVTALDGLRGVVLDRQPRWTGGRREAFFDWLRQGGRVYLLPDHSGQYPQFDGSLALLDRDLPSFRVGTGRVIRVAHSLEALDAETTSREILEDALSFRGAQPRGTVGGRGIFGEVRSLRLSRSATGRDWELLRHLQELSRYERHWIVIYLLVAGYILLLFPGCYALGRRARFGLVDPLGGRIGAEAPRRTGLAARWYERAFYAAFVGVTVLFSCGFARLGQLRADAAARIRTVATALQLGDGTYLVRQWSSAAVRVGGEYVLKHPGAGRLYTVWEEIEFVDGEITGGADAALVVRIPPAATRTFMHRSRASGVDIEFTVSRLTFEGDELSELTIETGPGFPAEPLRVLAWHRTRLFELRSVGSGWQLDLSSRTGGLSYLTEPDVLDSTPLVWRPAVLPRFGRTAAPEPSGPGDEERYLRLLPLLVGASLGLRETVEPARVDLGPDVVRLMVYAPVGEEFRATDARFTDQQGYVLYCFDLER
jgi:hypothetical protein